MSVQGIDALLKENALFRGLSDEDLETIAGCATNVRFEPGQFIFRENETANTFYLIRFGNVSVEFFAPGPGAITVQTRSEGDVLGWSWLFPPYVWTHDARALNLTRAIAFDAACLRGKLEHDPRLGYELMKRFGNLVQERLEATRLQLADLYGAHHAHAHS
jgi:CRP/FNR family transcriptional regulator, cyclic AMP receptor protein